MISNLLKVTLLGVILSLGSCCDCPEIPEQPAPEPAEYSGQEHLQMYFQSLHPTDQRVLFKGLPAQVRFDLVKNHLEKEKASAGNQVEADYIQSIIAFLKPEYYDDKAPLSEQAMMFLNQKVQEGLEVYGGDKAKLSSVIYELGGNAEADIVIAVWVKPDCECNMAIDICVFGDCGVFDCTASAGGCGPVWAMPCDGMCLDPDED